MQGSLEEDFAALRRLRDDDASGALKEFFRDREDPREWSCKVRRREKSCVTIADGRVTKLVLYECTSLAALPDAIGELKALTSLDLSYCQKLVALPDAIGELKALTELNLRGCSSLEKLPDVVAAREGLTVVLPDQLNGPLQEDFAALRKMLDDDASGALKEFLGDGENPRKWRGVSVEDGRVTAIVLYGCSNLTALPAAIGELKALTTLILEESKSLAELPAAIGELGALEALILEGCSSIAALPAAIGELGALTELDLSECSSLAALPDEIGELKALTTLNLK